MRSRAPFTLGFAVTALLLGRGSSSRADPQPGSLSYCSSDYADDLSQVASRVHELERQPYSVCVRNTAIYECLSYSADGAVRRTRKRAVLHGTAFAYRQQSGETFLLTNEHVAEWPSVTDDDHPVEGVPSGCKRVSDALYIVDNESDDYQRDDVALTRVAVDPQLDAAVVKAKTLLPVMPWRIGRSAGLKERNVVEVRGFPLGAFFATNVGKVISAYDHDDEKEWDHDDFVVDALLSQGNSGSPVLALSCKTGEFELVGLYHAGYTHGSALNVAVGIDQLRDLMTTFKRSPHLHAETTSTVDSMSRARLVDTIGTGEAPFFPFGPLAAKVSNRTDHAIVFELFARDFPFRSVPLFVFEDMPSEMSFGEVRRVWFGSALGLKQYDRTELDAEAQGQIARLIDALRRDVVAFDAYRSVLRRALTSREAYERASRLERTLHRTTASRRELAIAAVDLADRLVPRETESLTPIATVFVAPLVKLPPLASVATAPPSGRSTAAPLSAPAGPSL